MEHEHCGRSDHRAKQGWPRILATYQVRYGGGYIIYIIIYFVTFLKCQIREEWSSSQLLSPEIGQNVGIFSFRGFKGDYSFRFLLDGEQFGGGLDVGLEEDMDFRCDFSDEFDEQNCTE